MPYRTDSLKLGAAYYPEHWPEERWPLDADLMKEAGFSVVRMGEFAWSRFEEKEGSYDFDWLARAIELLADNGILTVLGTPTAAPPAWLTQKYPEVLAVDDRGQRLEHGNRCHYCVNSSLYHDLSKKIVREMGVYFGRNPHVIGWQIDNEFNRICYCDHCRSAFQEYLRDKYVSLMELNQAWSTAYWSQTYSAWSQIPIPHGEHNPGLTLAFQRFVTDSYSNYLRLQIAALRPKLNDEIWITHNFIGWREDFDLHLLSEDLDLVSWDWYVTDHHNDYLRSGAAHDLYRGLKRQNFWLMETQAGHIHWSPTHNNTLNRGETRAMAWHAVGHGADAVLYWQWRSAAGGQEQYYGTIIDQSGQPRPLYNEIKSIGAEFQKVGSLFAETSPEAQAAIIQHYPSQWITNWQPHHKEFSYQDHLLSYYRVLASKNIPVDIISADSDFSGYRLLILPALQMLNESQSNRFEDFVHRGGILVVTARTGFKGEFNQMLPIRPPGFLSEVCGIEVEEFYVLEKPTVLQGNSFEGVATIWAERLLVEGDNTRVIARYEPCNGWLDNQPGIAVNVDTRSGGKAYYIGAVLDQDSLESFMVNLVATNGLQSLASLPQGVEICRRLDPSGKQIGILINHTGEERRLRLPFSIKEQLRDEVMNSDLTLPPYDVLVFTVDG